MDFSYRGGFLMSETARHLELALELYEAYGGDVALGHLVEGLQVAIAEGEA